MPETDEEAYDHIEQPEDQGLKDGTPYGEEVTIVSDDETHHYAIVRWRGKEVRERIPLHVFKLAEGKKLQELMNIAKRLRQKLVKKYGLAPTGLDKRYEQQRRRRGRQLARQEAEEMLRPRVVKLKQLAVEANLPCNAWKNAEAYGRALGLREAAAHMFGQEPNPMPKPSKWLDDGADLVELAKELGILLEEAKSPEAPAAPVLPEGAAEALAERAERDPDAPDAVVLAADPPPAAPAPKPVRKAPKKRAKPTQKAKKAKRGKR